MTNSSDRLPDGIEGRIPVITLWQPWASLIFSGHKRYETRAYRYPIKYTGKRIAIHAAAALPASRHFSQELCDLCYDAFGCAWNFSLPQGVILGTAVLGMCVPSEEYEPSDDERAAGNWAAGRWGWRLWDIEPLAIPIPAKGKQGWWSIEASALSPSSTTQGDPL